MHYISGENRAQYIMTSYDEMIPQTSDIRKLDVMIERIYNECVSYVNWAGENGTGRRAYHPKDLLKLLIYGYINSIQSSRKLEEACHINIEVKWLLSCLAPDFKTIASFRRMNGDLFRAVSQRFQQIMHEHCFIDGKLVALDSIKVKANASRDYFSKRAIIERIAKSGELIEGYLSRLEENDIQSEIVDIDGKSVEEIRASIEALEKQKAELEKSLKIMNERGLNFIHPVDTDAVIVRTKEGCVPGYNVQTVVDSKHGMITAIEAEMSHNDQHSVGTMLNELESVLGVSPDVLVADTGYGNIELMQKVEKEHKTELIISMTPSSRENKEGEFRYLESEDVFICRAGKKLVRTTKKPVKHLNRLAVKYRCKECAGCIYAPTCHKSRRGRTYLRYVDEAWEKAYRSKMQESRSCQILKRRKAIVEHVFGTFRIWMGKIPLLLRSQRLVQAEMNLYALTYNLKRWLNIGVTIKNLPDGGLNSSNYRTMQKSSLWLNFSSNLLTISS
jgi:transposase